MNNQSQITLKLVKHNNNNNKICKILNINSYFHDLFNCVYTSKLTVEYLEHIMP